MTTQLHEVQRARIIAAQQNKSSETSFLIWFTRVKFPVPLDFDNIFYFRQTAHRFRRPIAASTGRHIIQNLRQVSMLSDGFEMLIQTFLRRTIVVRGYRQQPTIPLSLKRCVRLMASAVALAPVPAITGMRPSASSSVIITTSACSS